MVVGNKTGFKCLDIEVTILDNNGNVFYHKKNKNYPKPILFNLPKGIYKPLNIINRLNKPVLYQLPNLYSREKKVPLKRLKLILLEHENKARIDINTGKVEISPSFLKNKCQLAFLFWHEIGHFFYFTEHKCDRFAENKMLKYGFNPSQVAEASLGALNCKIKSSFERQKKTFNTQKNI